MKVLFMKKTALLRGIPTETRMILRAKTDQGDPTLTKKPYPCKRKVYLTERANMVDY
jgi:hypothetical protein